MKLYNYLKGIEVLETTVTRFDMDISGVTSRTDEVENNYIYVCLKGLTVDGHKFADKAKEKGATLLVVEKADECIRHTGLPYIKVKNTRAILALMCSAHNGHPEEELKIIAVTGTNGKTSTCRILSEIYVRAGFSVVTMGTLDGGLTTRDPEDLFKALRKAFDNGADTVIMEASSHALYLDKLYGVIFDGAIFTNLTEEHLDFHKNMDEYALAKAKLFSMSRFGVYNADDEYCEKVSSTSYGRKYFYSLYNRNADFYIENYKENKTDGFEYELIAGSDIINVKSKLCGMFNVYNTMSACAFAYLDGIDKSIIEKGVSSVLNVKGRLEKLELYSAPFSVYIDYAHTPDALEKVLLCIRSFKHTEQKITVLFGCGGDRDRLKRRTMGQIASRLADFVIVTSDNSRSENPSDIISEIMKGIDKERPHIVIENRREAIEYAIMTADDNDIILLAGKGHEEYEIDSNGKRYFSEKEIAEKAVYKRFKGNDNRII
ncbi:MAG: UDP-N-acetylmuramoyl-L-alanyl-D-glutamate--2,6-diaminopimelate ligase [Ruminococcaceae bacterium]|nr:UDP-N-acetylmuramoyl-L-alanyl-D-glutamate--2,6-diaminopimelate ligase [Oscillospiraceae bacterium]